MPHWDSPILTDIPSVISEDDFREVADVIKHEPKDCILLFEYLISRYDAHPFLTAQLGKNLAAIGAPGAAFDQYQKTQQKLATMGLQNDSFDKFLQEFKELIQRKHKEVLDSELAKTYAKPWRPTKEHKFPLNLPQPPVGHQEIKDDWSKLCPQGSGISQQYLTKLAIETNHVESVFFLTDESAQDLVRRGAVDGEIVASPRSAISDPDVIRRILNDTLSAYDILPAVSGDPSKLDREFVCNVHGRFMKTCRFQGRRYTPPGMTRSTTGKTVIIAGSQYNVPCCPYLQVDEELDYICRMAKQYIKTWERNPFATAAWVHLILARCHPFDDGNGRVTRLISSISLVRLGYPPISIGLTQRPDYYGAINKAYDGDYGPFSECILAGMKETILVITGNQSSES